MSITPLWDIWLKIMSRPLGYSNIEYCTSIILSISKSNIQYPYQNTNWLAFVHTSLLLKGLAEFPSVEKSSTSLCPERRTAELKFLNWIFYRHNSEFASLKHPNIFISFHLYCKIQLGCWIWESSFLTRNVDCHKTKCTQMDNFFSSFNASQLKWQQLHFKVWKCCCPVFLLKAKYLPPHKFNWGYVRRIWGKNIAADKLNFGKRFFQMKI